MADFDDPNELLVHAYLNDTESELKRWDALWRRLKAWLFEAVKVPPAGADAIDTDCYHAIGDGTGHQRELKPQEGQAGATGSEIKIDGAAAR